MKYDFEIIGEIGYGYGSTEYVAWMLEGMQGREVNIRVNSLGGSAIAGLDIATRLKEHGNCIVHMMGMNASAATILAMGAKKVCMDSNGGMLIHKCMIWLEELGNMNADDLRQAIEEMERTANQADSYDAIALKWYMNRCADKKTPEEVLELMKEDKFISAEEALEWGFIDEIEDCAETPAAQARASAWVAQADASVLARSTMPTASGATAQDTTTNTTNNENMNKTYSAIATLAGINAPYQAIADKEGNVGCYMAEAQLDVLEVAAAKAQADAEALAKAKTELAVLAAAKEVFEAKQTEMTAAHAEAIASLKTEHEQALAALRAEMEAEKTAAVETAKAEMQADLDAKLEAMQTEHTAAIEAASAHHSEEVSHLQTEHATALAAKDAELATAHASLEEANGKVSALEAQVAELAAAAPEPQTPPPAPVIAPQDKVKAYADMSTAEKAQYEKEQRKRRMANACLPH